MGLRYSTRRKGCYRPRENDKQLQEYQRSRRSLFETELDWSNHVLFYCVGYCVVTTTDFFNTESLIPEKRRNEPLPAVMPLKLDG